MFVIYSFGIILYINYRTNKTSNNWKAQIFIILSIIHPRRSCRCESYNILWPARPTEYLILNNFYRRTMYFFFFFIIHYTNKPRKFPPKLHRSLSKLTKIRSVIAVCIVWYSSFRPNTVHVHSKKYIRYYVWPRLSWNILNLRYLCYAPKRRALKKTNIFSIAYCTWCSENGRAADFYKIYNKKLKWTISSQFDQTWLARLDYKFILWKFLEFKAHPLPMG